MECAITEQTAKRMKYEMLHATEKVNADLELEKEKLRHEERILEMKHKRERENEAHQLRMLQMQMSLRGGNHRAFSLGLSMPLDAPGEPSDLLNFSMTTP